MLIELLKAVIVVILITLNIFILFVSVMNFLNGMYESVIISGFFTSIIVYLIVIVVTKLRKEM